MEIKRFKITDIAPAPYNPRVVLKRTDREYKDILNSLEKYGLVVPPIVNIHNNHCVSGHQRLSVLADLGHTEVDCVVVDIDDEAKEKALCIALNKIKGQWDETKLTSLLTSLDAEGAGLDDIGFTEYELGYYISSEEEEEDEEDDDPGEDESEEDNGKSAVVCKIANYNITMEREEYEAMIREIKRECGFDDKSICLELERRLCNG